MSKRLLGSLLLLVLCCWFSGCTKGNAEPYSVPRWAPNSPVPMSPSAMPKAPAPIWLDPDYTCLKNGERIFSPRNTLELGPQPKLTGDLCGNNARDLRADEIESYQIDSLKGVDEGIYESIYRPTETSTYVELVCLLKSETKRMEIVVKTDSRGKRFGKKLVVENDTRTLLEADVELKRGWEYEGAGFNLQVEAAPIAGKPGLFEGTLKGERAKMECRTLRRS